MGLSRKGQSLKIIFLKYLFSVGVGLVLAIGLAMITFDIFYNVGLIIPANYTENQILKNKSKSCKLYLFILKWKDYSVKYE